MARPEISLGTALALVAVGTIAAAPASSARSVARSPKEAAGSALVFATYRNGLSAISAMNADGSDRRSLTPRQLAFQGQPAYSPDGSKIAYVCGNFELCVMNADGTGRGRLTTSGWPQRWEYVDRPSWSPDGSKIAFASNADGKFHVYVINADGTGLHRLAGTSWNDDDPAISPDGTKIAFDRYRSWGAGISSTYVMNFDGTQPRRLSASGDDDWYPAWSPDGTRIVFSSYRGDYTHLFLMNASGGDEQQLTGGSCEETDGAPDAPTLAFERNCGRRLGIALGSPGGRIVRITAPQHGFDLYPAWRPAGTGGTPAAPVAPPSTPTGDARLLSTYFYWETQVASIDFLPESSVRGERRIRADDLRAVRSVAAARPDTEKGRRLKQIATAAFRADAAAARQYLLSYGAARGRHRAAAKYERAGDNLARLAERKFDAADNIGTLPY